MKLGATRLLGLAIDDRGIGCAQVGNRGKLQKWARFEPSGGVSLDNPEVLGNSLKAFLAEQDIHASRAVVGLPARWLIAEARDLPPVGRDQALASLRLQAERISLGDEASLIFDAAGTFGNGQAGHALLVGVSRDRLGRINRLCSAAGITPASVTATGLVVADMLPGGDAGPTILLSGQGAELVWRTGTGPRSFRHLSGSSGTPALVGEIRRVLALGQLGARHDEGRVLVVGDPSFSDADATALSERLGRPVSSSDPAEALQRRLPALASLNGQSDDLTTQRLWPAVALASAAGRGAALPVNFLRPRLAPPRVSRLNRKWVAGIAAGILVVAGGYLLWDHVNRTEAEAEELEQLVDELRPDVEVAEARIARVNFGRGFFETRPPILACLNEVTAAFGPDDPIWTTSFSMRENGRGQIQGRATDNRSVLQLRDRLTANPNLADVQLVDLREAAGARTSGGEVSFTLSFRYAGAGLGEGGDRP